MPCPAEIEAFRDAVERHPKTGARLQDLAGQIEALADAADDAASAEDRYLELRERTSEAYEDFKRAEATWCSARALISEEKRLLHRLDLPNNLYRSAP